MPLALAVSIGLYRLAPALALATLSQKTRFFLYRFGNLPIQRESPDFVGKRWIVI